MLSRRGCSLPENSSRTSPLASSQAEGVELWSEGMRTSLTATAIRSLNSSMIRSGGLLKRQSSQLRYVGDPKPALDSCRSSLRERIRYVSRQKVVAGSCATVNLRKPSLEKRSLYEIPNLSPTFIRRPDIPALWLQTRAQDAFIFRDNEGSTGRAEILMLLDDLSGAPLRPAKTLAVP